MKQVLKDHLRHAFEAPPPLHKKQFLRRLSQPRMSMWEFMLSQVGYIRRWTWGISVLVFALSLLGAGMLSDNTPWIISAFTPLLALTVVSECGRSESYEMAELEMATRFSLRSVVIARLGILGLENLAIFCLLIPVGIWNRMLDPVSMGLSILTPYLLTTFLGMYIVRRFRGREAVYFCACIAGLVSVSVCFYNYAFPQIWQEQHFVWQIAAAVLLCAGTVRQTSQIINGTEELT